MHGVIQIHFLVTIKHESVENNNSTVESKLLCLSIDAQKWSQCRRCEDPLLLLCEHLKGDYDDDNGCGDSVVTSVDISIVQCPPGTRQKAGNYPPRSAARLHLYTLHFRLYTPTCSYGHFLSDYLLFNICVHFLQFKGELISIFEHFILSTFTTIAPEYEVHTSCFWISRYLPTTYLSV